MDATEPAAGEPQTKPVGKTNRGGKSPGGLNPGQPRGPGGKLMPTRAGGDPGPGAKVDQRADMEHVYTRPKAADATPGQKACRKWFEGDPKGFLQQMAKMQEEDRTREAGVIPSTPAETGAVPDDGTRDVMELAERLLAEWRERR